MDAVDRIAAPGHGTSAHRTRPALAGCGAVCSDCCCCRGCSAARRQTAAASAACRSRCRRGGTGRGRKQEKGAASEGLAGSGRMGLLRSSAVRVRRAARQAGRDHRERRHSDARNVRHRSVIMATSDRWSCHGVREARCRRSAVFALPPAVCLSATAIARVVLRVSHGHRRPPGIGRGD